MKGPNENLGPLRGQGSEIEEEFLTAGDWIHRTGFWESRKKSPAAKLSDHLEKRLIHLSKLLTLNGLDDGAYRGTIRDICAEIARKQRVESKNKACLGVGRVTRERRWRERTALKDRMGCM